MNQMDDLLRKKCLNNILGCMKRLYQNSQISCTALGYTFLEEKVLIHKIVEKFGLSKVVTFS